MKPKIVTLFLLLFVSLKAFAQTPATFHFNCAQVVKPTYIAAYLKEGDNKIELLDGSAGEFIRGLILPTGVTNYTLSVEFNYKIEGSGTSYKESIEYPFTLAGDETEVEITLRIDYNYSENKVEGKIEVLPCYPSQPGLKIEYAPLLNENPDYKGPFFMLTNNTKETIYGRYLPYYYWGTLRSQTKSEWGPDYFGELDLDFAERSLLTPGSVAVATVGSFGYSNDLEKDHYRYKLLYSTEDKTNSWEIKDSQNKNFTWKCKTAKYYRLVYVFKVE